MHNFLPVHLTGQFKGKPLYVLTSEQPWGAGFQQIVAFETETRTVLVERGYIPEEDKTNAAPPTHPVTFEAILHWPSEVGVFTPDPDIDQNIWFGRDIEKMAAYLNTEPILAVIRPTERPSETWPRPVITDARAIPNNHLEYAITWFSLGMVWMTMSMIWAYRIRRSIRVFQ